MTTMVTRDAGTDDAEAITELQRLFGLQRTAFIADPYPSAAERRSRIEAIPGMLVGYRDRIRKALSEDFAVHPEQLSDLVEILGVAGRAMYGAANLEEWMKDDDRPVDPGVFGTGRAMVRYQPKGVIGNIVPWNFPFDLSVGPLVEMLAAGNRTIIKPSDYTPACGELLREMITETFDPSQVAVVVGGVELAKTFPTLRWDHLLYTGSPAIGRDVMRAAAENLVPVTLELGGKCPAIVTSDGLDEEAVRNIIGVKLLKNGQMCISVDYVLVPRSDIDRFVDIARRVADETLQGYATSPDCAGIITERHLDRLLGLLAEARSSGAEVVTLGGDAEQVNRDSRQLPLSLVVDPPDQIGIMTEEIFGPILPIKPYDSLDEALAWVNAGERPLALYVFTKDDAVADRVLSQTISGGACVNACAMHGAMPSLGFGGSGQSGMGRHHGIEGFREFSNPKGVFVRGEGDLSAAFCPPYGDLANGVVAAALGGGD
ncbi:MAG: coniferyl aldehyde dehydrogenase [Acidimicrobiales bacterium]